MRNSKGLSLLLLGFAILSLSLVGACGETGPTSPSQDAFNTYANDEWGCAISYPNNWEIQVVPEDGTCLISSPTLAGRGSVRLDVIPALLSAEEAAERYLMALGTAWGSVTLLQNMKMQGLWDWYLSYDYDSGYGEFHGEAFFKETPDHLYKIDTAGEKLTYDTFPFPEIISTFELLSE